MFDMSGRRRLGEVRSREGLASVGSLEKALKFLDGITAEPGVNVPVLDWPVVLGGESNQTGTVLDGESVVSLCRFDK